MYVYMQFLLKDWMLPIVDIVSSYPVNTAEESGKKVMVGIIIICFIGRLFEAKLLVLHEIPISYAARLLQTLCLHPDMENKKCLDYEFVRNLIPNNYLKECTTAISVLGNYLIVNADIESAEWLYCLPVLHFLNNDVRPFDVQGDVPFDKIKFPDPHLKLGTICKTISEKEG